MKLIKVGYRKSKFLTIYQRGHQELFLIQKKEPYDNVNIRKAIAHLFDVEKLNKRLFFNEYVRLNTFFYGTPYANPIIKIIFQKQLEF